ncbi:MAG TPA: UDP-N-acetylglucosamine 2-epimerase (non-hydrolyzing) [Candidatus Limnocylindrales bacterium]|nr:UDP-N-acetylglucosamine 2-epimerase (non-hydrolyzing) [Candidatus Limnocylindrales bacterium]
MKVVTILGTRPEIIRLSRVIPLLDRLCRHVLVHTGQNFEPVLSDLFFDDLQLRPPDHQLSGRGTTTMEQVARILVESERVLAAERPDRVLILGDTNSALAAIVAKRLGIPVYHMEAGNRCFDDRVPEEVNRRIVDHSSDVLLPYTERSRTNLLREGISPHRIHVTGNPIREVLEFYAPQIERSDAATRLGLTAGAFLLVTLHRAENVDVPGRLAGFVEAFRRLGRERGVPVVWSVHPRTRSVLDQLGLELGDGIVAIEPVGLFDFASLMRQAQCVLTDSGTVQEECCIFLVPSVTLRDVTERPETLDVGSTILSGADPDAIVAAVDVALASPPDWTPVAEYLARDVSSAVARIVIGRQP